MAQAGWKNYVLGTAHITHLGQQSTGQAPAAMKAELFRSKLRYFRKQHGAMAAQWLRLGFSASILARLFYYRLRRWRAQLPGKSRRVFPALRRKHRRNRH